VQAKVTWGKNQCCRELAVQGCRDIIQWWRDHRLKFPALSDLAGNTFCVMATSAASERVFNMTRNVVNSTRSKYKEFVSERQSFSTTLLKLRTKRSKLIKRFVHFYLYSVIKSVCWLWNEPRAQLPLAMKHAAWVFCGFQTHSGRCKAEVVRVGRAQVGTVHRMYEEGGLEICRTQEAAP